MLKSGYTYLGKMIRKIDLKLLLDYSLVKIQSLMTGIYTKHNKEIFYKTKSVQQLFAIQMQYAYLVKQHFRNLANTL